MNASQNSAVQRVFKGGSLPGDLVVLRSVGMGAYSGYPMPTYLQLRPLRTR